MQVHVVQNEDVSYMDKLLLDSKGMLQPVAAKELLELPPTHLMIWGNKNGVYTFPTHELIDWIREKINGRKAIEICAGNGVIGRSLGITSTDSYIQTTPEMVFYYKAINQVPIFPPCDVLKFEANEAVDHFKPEVVVGCYVTQKYLYGDEGPPKIASSFCGTDELLMLSKIKTYIFVGNFSTHKDKRIRSQPHTVYKFPWICTRAGRPEENEIVVWNKNG